MPTATGNSIPAYINAKLGYLKTKTKDATVEVDFAEVDYLVCEFNASLNNDGFKVSTQDVLASSTPQKLLNETRYKDQAQKLKNQAAGNEAKRLMSNFSNPALWMQSVPSNSSLRFDSAVFRHSVRVRLGLTVRNKQRMCSVCNIPADYHGLHDMRCKKVVTTVHHALRDKLYNIMNQAHLRVDKETRDLLKDNPNDRPADVYWIEGVAGKDLCLDVSVVDYAKDDGIFKREEEKKKKYSSRCANHGLVFKPLVVNTLGHFSKEFDSFISRIGRERAEAFRIEIHDSIKFVRESLQSTVVQVTAECALSLMANMEF